MHYDPKAFAAYAARVTDDSREAHEATVALVAFHGTRRAAPLLVDVTRREADMHGNALRALVAASTA